MTLRRLKRRVRALFAREAVERELNDEMREHLLLEIEDLIRTRGLSRPEAERQARLRFGGVDRYTEGHRDARGTRWLEDVVADTRYALRALMHSPAFTLSTIAVLGMGIAVSTAIFSAVNAVILSRLPYPKDHQLFRISNANSPTNLWGLSVVDFQAIGVEQRTMSAFGVLSLRDVPVAAGAAEPVRTRVSFASSGIFAALDVRAAVGRVIQRADESEAAAPVAVVSDGYATRAYGSASAALGRTVEIDGVARPIVGILPAGVKDLGGYRSEIWPSFQPRAPTRRGPFGIIGIGRVRDGVAPEAAKGDLRAISRRIFPLWSRGFADTSAHYAMVPLREAIIGNAPKILWLFAAAAGLLLLTAMVNVANLMLARMSAREREMSLRLVLGASRDRLIRLVLTESMLVSVVGIAVGALAAWLMLRVFVGFAGSIPRLSGATLDVRALGFAIGAGVLTAFVMGVHPVTNVLRRDTAPSIKGGDREIGGRSGARARAVLVSLQFALALPLLAGASQLIDSIARLQRVDPGFDPAPVAYARIGLPQARYDSVPRIAAYWTRAMRDVAAIPGVIAVGYTTDMPPSGAGNHNNFLLDGSSFSSGAPEPVSVWLSASPGYFDALGVRVVQGRMFTAADTGGGDLDQALIVSASWAKRYSPDRPIVGRRIFEGGCRPDTCPATYIVGVVSDVKYDGMSQGGEAAYFPAVMTAGRTGYLAIRTSADPQKVLRPVRAALQDIDRSVAIDEVAPLSDRVYASTAQPRHLAMLLTAFAGAAVILAAVGVFGLLAYLVAMMRREIGVRVALGAQRGMITAMIVKRGVVQSAAGAALGILLAIAGRKLLESSLYEATPGDPLTIAAVSAILIGIAAIAAWIPARRAAAADPMTAIRSD